MTFTNEFNKAPIDLKDPRQNEFVQDWLSEFMKGIPTDRKDYDHIGETIEMVQEIYEARYDERYKDIVADKVVATTDEYGKVRQVEAYGHQLDGKRTWILIHIHSSCELKVALEETSPD